jgi:hypothetical protein
VKKRVKTTLGGFNRAKAGYQQVQSRTITGGPSRECDVAAPKRAARLRRPRLSSGRVTPTSLELNPTLACAAGL